MAPFALPSPGVEPVTVHLPGPIDVRWYGLMYLVGFVVGYLVQRWLSGGLLVWTAATGPEPGGMRARPGVEPPSSHSTHLHRAGP